MYRLISKPKRMSLAAGVCHFMVYLLKNAADYGESCTELFRTQGRTVLDNPVLHHRQNIEFALMTFLITP